MKDVRFTSPKSDIKSINEFDEIEERSDLLETTNNLYRLPSNKLNSKALIKNNNKINNI